MYKILITGRKETLKGELEMNDATVSTMHFTNFNLINGFLILIFMITELSKLYDIDIKKDLIKIILQVLSLLYVYVYMLHLNF